MPVDAEPLLDIHSLTCAYGDHVVLRDINLRLAAGEMAGLLGPNGSGKSTLLLALAGVLQPTHGRVSISGQEVHAADARWRARQMASVPQKITVSFPFKCLSAVLMGRYPYLQGWGDYSREDLDLALAAMEQTGTLHLAARPLPEVSGGEAQMVMIARALAQEAPMLLLDEATSALDAAHKIQIFDLLREKNRQGLTLLGVMHDINLAALYCQRLIFLKQGQIMADGPKAAIFTAEILSELYETEIRVGPHPVTGDPQAYFVPAGAVRSARFHDPGLERQPANL
ncbi:MAG TPA: ABC transporter ATP-binding protein [Thermodesulfobacteriota bacterium]|nr:ABC transporter ATP-binding protein [Thermodesulfobacteriota bacterium]